MDVLSPVFYRGFPLNSVTITPGGKPIISGCQIDTFDPGDDDVVQFVEKRSEQDGMDAGPVFLGGRRILLAGTLYGVTRAAFFDQMQLLRKAMSPTLAFRESPGDKGYQPLTWSVPTTRTAEYPTNEIDLQINVLPRRLQMPIDRDATGGVADNPLAIRWQVVMTAKDPTITAQVAQLLTFTPTVNRVGNFTNRGDYHAPLNMLFEVTAAAGVLTVAVGGSNFQITVPASTGNRIIRYNGSEKTLMKEESSVESLAMSWLTFQNSTTHPLIPGGVSPYSFNFSGGLTLANSGSFVSFMETFA